MRTMDETMALEKEVCEYWMKKSVNTKRKCKEEEDEDEHDGSDEDDGSDEENKKPAANAPRPSSIVKEEK